MNLIEAFDIRSDEVIGIIGAGGKTTLMFTLAKELAASGHKVITTATTRLAAGEPKKFDSPLFLEKNTKKLIELIPEKLKQFNTFTVACKLDKEKLIGYPPETIDRIASLGLANIIVEADGARGKPIKAPNATEPVIPQSTTLVIPVVGLDSLGKALNEDNTFRPEIISKLTGLRPSEPVTGDVIYSLLTHPQGITKGSPSTARIIPLLNKTASDLVPAAESIARRILVNDNRIQKVVVGQIAAGEVNAII